MGKFGNLAAQVSIPFKVTLIDSVTALPITDKAGKPSYVEVLSTDSIEGRLFDKQRGVSVNRKLASGRSNELVEEDNTEINIAKLATLTKSWYLVDPVTQDEIEVPCTPENATELYSAPETAHIYRQVFMGATSTANFSRRPAKTSSDTPNTSSGMPAG